MALSAADRQRRYRLHKAGDHSLCDPGRPECDDEDATAGVTPPALRNVPRLSARGRALWSDMKGDELPAGLRVLLGEACRIADRLERLDAYLTGDTAAWLELSVPDDGSGPVQVVVDKALSEARQQQVALKQLLSEIRQATAPTKTSNQTPEKPATGGGGVLADLTARIAARRDQTAG